MQGINLIYTTEDKGRIHIAADKAYLGSVNSYNNCMSRFFAWVFRLSTNVEINGEQFSFNKRSYRKLVNSLTQQDVKVQDIASHRVFRNVAENGRLPGGKGWMRDHLSTSKKESLTKGLIDAVLIGDDDKAIKMIGKGAALDKMYSVMNGKRGSSNHAYFYTGSENFHEKIFIGTPLHIAANKSRIEVAKRLVDFGANRNLQATSYTYNWGATYYCPVKSDEKEFRLSESLNLIQND